MRFLFRSVFFLTLIFVTVAFLAPQPDHSNQNRTDDRYNVLDALSAVRSTVTDLGSFCTRNPETCAAGKSFFSALGVKARDGARITYEFLDAKFGNKGEASSGKADSSHADPLSLARPPRATHQVLSHPKKQAEEKRQLPQ